MNDDGIVEVNQQQLLSMDLDETTSHCLLNQIEQLATSDDARISERSAEQTSETTSEEPSSTYNNDKNNSDSIQINPNNKKFRKSRNAISTEVRREVFANFKDWLTSITNVKVTNSLTTVITNNKKIDVIIDGANVGYFKKN